MLVAKIKTAALVLCGVAALGLGSGGVYYQTRARASDSQQLNRTIPDNSQSSSEPREREIDKPNLPDKPTTPAPQVPPSANELDDTDKAVQRAKAIIEYANLKKRIAWQRAKIEEWRKNLEEMEKREEVLLKRLAELDPKIGGQVPAPSKQRTSQPSSRGVDKLDQILERLQYLEKRLDHLERGGRKELPKLSP